MIASNFKAFMLPWLQWNFVFKLSVLEPADTHKSRLLFKAIQPTVLQHFEHFDFTYVSQ